MHKNRRYCEVDEYGYHGSYLYFRVIKVQLNVLYQWIKQYKSVYEKVFEEYYTIYSPQYKMDIINFDYTNKKGGIREIVEKIFVDGREHMI
ncbi:hypothetical protein BK708_29210 [Bacillus thuringiensis serovar yunnanensis]|nr:hypothetical protein BK708_29210 [Bacillus thuringiensis serovar yunnanensis]